MADQQFVRARLLAEELMALPKAERAPHLREACGGDHGLYAAAQQLLNEAEAATSFLEEMNLDMTTGLVGSGKPVLPERIGPFRITRLIAAGGWSVIYEGLQKNPSRKVAIKVLHASLTSSSAQQRFTYESEVLARLRHPGIAEIFHAGTFDSSTGPCPYFALELIEEAMHFDTWAEKQQLSLDDRLEMFAYLCDIVHYGHTRGVVHCDLKPGNILIDREGRLRVIDFGIAMAVGDDGLQAADITETGRIVGTIHYMAPEQFSGDLERIDARTDVRALGVVLYELLTGQRPWDLSGIPAHEAMRLVQTKKPVPAGQLEPSLRGDLDTIIAKAMQDDPDDRYGSALELRQDVDRYRASLPIQARPPGTIRTARLFVRRHQISVGVATVVTLALCAALVVTLVAWRRAIRATANAEIAAAIAKREAARATSTTDVLTDMFSLAHPAVSAGGAIGVERMLDEATEYTGSAFQNDPESASKIRRALARIQLGVGDLDGAEANLSFIPPFEHPEDPAALETEVLRARVEHVRGDMNASESRLLAIINENPTSEDPSVIEALGTLAAVRVEQLDYPRAAPLLEKAIQRASRSLGPDDPKTIELQAQLGRTNAGLVMMRVPDAPDVNAPPPYGHLDRVVALLGATHPTTFLARLSESDRLFVREKMGPQSLERLQSIYDDARDALGPLHPRTLETSIELAGFLKMLGQRDAAEALFRQSIDAYDATIGPGHAHAAIATLALGEMVLVQGNHAEAAEILEGSWQTNHALWGAKDPRTIEAEANLALALLYLDRIDDALPRYRSALPRLVATPFLGRNNLYWSLRGGLLDTAVRTDRMALYAAEAEQLRADVATHLPPDSPLAVELLKAATAPQRTPTE